MARRSTNKRNILSVNNDNNGSETASRMPKKRSRTASASKDGEEVPQNFFTKLVKKAGCTLHVKGNKIETGSVTFWQNLNKLVEMHDENISETVETFASALEENMEDESVFVSCLMPTEISVPLDELGLSSSQVPDSIQDSLLKMMLHCDHLQSSVISILLKKLPLYAENENVKVDACFGVGDASGADILNMPRLILNQLRWIDLIKDSAKVATQLLEMASVMHSGVACDIICFIPDLLPDDNDHADVAMMLCELLNNGPNNTISAIFDALSNLALTNDVEASVYDLAVSYLTTASLEDIPVIVKYLLKSCKNLDSAKQIITVLRPHLDFYVLLSNTTKENEQKAKSSAGLIADIMFSCVQSQPFVATAWLNVLEKIRPNEFHTGDFIALLLCAGVNHMQRRKNAINLLHSKLKRGLLPESILNRTVETCGYIISSQFKSVCQLTKGLLWHSDPALKRTAALLYELYLLKLDDFSKQVTVGVLVEHISCMTKEKNSETDIALDVLCSVCVENPGVLVPYANFIREAVDRMDLMTLLQVRKSYRVLCHLAYSGATDAMSRGMQDETQICLRKQLSHISNRYRHIGIIGCVTALYAMSSMENEANSVALHKEINSLLDTLNYVLRNDIRGWYLFFDEVFISLGSESNLSAYLLKRINDDAQSRLQDKFLTDYNGTESSSCTHHDIQCCYRFGLLSPDEQKETELGIQLTPLLLNSRNRYITSLLCSVFRAISCLERKATGSLGEIDALLCCPILLHDVVYENKSRFADLDPEKSMFILDSLFSVINWFRELISVFCIETDPEMELNVLVRLKQTCDLECTVERLLPLAPDNYLPAVVNSRNVDLPGSGRVASAKFAQRSNNGPSTSGTQKGKPSLNTTIGSTAPPTKPSKKKDKKTTQAVAQVSLFSPSYRPYLRELSKEVFVLLKHPLQRKQSGQQNLAEDATGEERFLRPRHLLLLLNDLNEKLRHRLSAVKLPVGFGHQSDVGVGFERLDQVSINKVAELAVKLLPHACRHLENINSYFQDQLSSVSKSADNLDDSMSSQHSGLSVFQHERLSACYVALLEICYHVINWHGLEDDGNKALLEAALKAFSGRLSSPQQEKQDWTMTISTCFRYLHKFSATVPTSHAAHTLLKLLVTARDFADGHKSQQSWMSKKISTTAHEFLKKDWNDLSTAGGNAQKRNNTISGLFTIHLNHSEDVLDSVEQFLKNSLCYLLDDPVELDSENAITYPCLTKANFYVFYKRMLETLSSQAALIPSSSKSQASSSDTVDILLRWSEVVKVLDMLIRILKTFSTRVMLGPALKFARSILESFIRSGIPVCEVTFREHQDDVINLLKKVQISTRQLQHATCHSKVSKDASLTNHVPALKRCLETFVFRVKALLVLHNCHEAFWLGNLKNRNLQGEELFSQVPPSPTSDDDEVVDVTDDNAGQEGSYSESY